MGLVRLLFLFLVFLTGSSESKNLKHQIKPITINIGIAYDKTAVDRAFQALHLNKTKDLLTETQKLIRETEKLFATKLFGRKIKLNLLKTRLLKRNVYLGIGVHSRISADELMEAYCLWQKIIKERDQLNYFSVLVTGMNLYVPQGEKHVDKKGVAYGNSYCEKTKSCSVLRWQPLKDLSLILAHEIGHSLGMRHDTAENGCNPSNSIMTKRFKSRKRLHQYEFTKCNADSLNRFLASKKGSCLR